MLIRRQHRAQAHHAAVIDMTERAFVRVIACRDGALVIVGVVMAFQVIPCARYRRPGLWPVQGMKPVVLRLPRTNRCECVIGVKHLDRAIDIPIGGGAQGGVQDSAVFVDGHGSVGRRTHR